MTFKFEIPEVVRIDGVDGSPQPRSMDVGSEKLRQQEVSKTKGMPITEFRGSSNPYIDYESIDLLLSLQHLAGSS
jgi:tryptophan 2,3-dioxygenase